MFPSRLSLCAGLLLPALLCGAAPTQWSENLVKNGDFARGSGTVAENWNPGFFDGAKGSVEWRPGSGPDSAAALNFSFTPPPKGLIQAESSLVRLPEQGPRKLRLRVRYRGAGMIQIRFFALNEKREMALLRTAAGTGIKLDRVLEKATDWKSVSTDWMLSPELLSRKPFAAAVIMHWPNSSGLSVASLSLQVNVPEPGKAAEPQKTVRINPPPSRVSPPVDRPAPAAPYRFEIDGRTLKKDGKTHYFVGTLCSEWTVNSLWLRGLLGYDYIAVHHGDGIRAVENRDKQVEIGFENRSYVYSYMTETLRNGMLPQLCIAQSYEYSPFFPLGKFHPEIREFFITGNHSMSLDMLSQTAGKLYSSTFENDNRFFGHLPLLAYEILREPGYTPSHDRPRKAFTEFVRKKYGTLEKVNQAWGTSLKSWDEVAPSHLVELKLAMDWSARLAVLEHLYRSRPGNYFDWLEFLRGDFVSGAGHVKQLLRQQKINAPFTYDCRMQSHYFDGYAAVDPELAATVNDILFCHTGYRFFDYGGRPADSASVLLSILDSVLYHDFLAHNIDKPILNTENIVTTVAASGSSKQAMEENCFGKFHGMAKFTLVPNRDDIKPDWFKVDFDDSAWKRIPVPGAWDETPQFKGRKGWGCYRFKFFMPSGIVRQSFLDSTVRYLLYGKGVAQRGEFWLNGKKLGKVAGWDTKYQFDVGGLLNYGKENILVVVVDGNTYYSEGLRSYLYLLSDRMISESKPFREENYRQMLWSNIIHGVSGNTIWHWDNNVHYFMPRVKAEIEAAAPLALENAGPRGQAAILYPFESFRGMLNSSAKNYQDYMSYFGAMLFSGIPTDTLSCRTLAKLEPGRYPLLVLPYASLVRKGVWEQLRRAVEEGGATAVVTFDSLIWSDDGYRRIPIEEFAGVKVTADTIPAGLKLRLDGREYLLVKGDYCNKAGVRIEPVDAEVIATCSDGTPAITVKQQGKGKICYVASRLDLPAASALVARLGAETGLTRPVELQFADTREYPYIETRLVGTPERFLLYLTNWGGTTRELTVKVTDEAFLGAPLRMRNLREWAAGGKTETAGAEKLLRDGLKLTLPSQSPVGLLFEREDQPRMAVEPPPEETLRMLGELKRLAANPAEPAGKRVLFLTGLESEDKDFGIDYFPVLAQMLRRQGFTPWSESPARLTPEALRDCAMVVLSEECALIYNRLVQGKFPTMLRNYVSEGGSLLLLISSNPYRPNSNRSVLLSRILRPAFRIQQEGICENPRACGNGDPLQIRATDLKSDHPISSNVKAVQFFVASSLRLMDPRWTAVVRAAQDDLRQKGQPVVAAGEFGQGRIVVAGDSLWLAPGRVEEADNLQFLQNVIDWLGRRPVSRCDREAVLRELPVTAERMRGAREANRAKEQEK